MNRKTIYIASKISGLEKEVYEREFELMAQSIRHTYQCNVVNPVELCGTLSINSKWEDYMRHCLRAMLFCDAVYFWGDWQNSKGAKIEHDLAKALNIPVFYENSETDELSDYFENYKKKEFISENIGRVKKINNDLLSSGMTWGEIENFWNEIFVQFKKDKK
jgi:hypothetical protein